MNANEDYFAKLENMGIKLTEGQKEWYWKKAEILHENMLREYPSYPEEAFMASQVGNWYASQLKELYENGRVTKISYDKAIPMHTAWDLGQADYTCIWFFQINRAGEIMVVDYFQKSDTPLDEIVRILNSKGYTYGTHIWPHDARARDRAGITFENQAHEFSLSGIILEQHGLIDGINLVRTTLSKMWFDEEKCKDGLTALTNYKKRWNTTIGGFTSQPVHDDASHGCFPEGTFIQTEKGELDISLIEIGDSVLTPNGYKKVLNKFVYNADTLQDIETTTGKIKCTHNHKIFTRKGLIHSGAMRYNDEVFSVGDMDICQSIGFHGQEKGLGFRDYFLSTKMKSVFTLMENDISGMENITERRTKKHHHLAHYKGQFGRTIMEKYQETITFIIKMLTQKIMTYQIWNSLVPVTIPSCILQMKKEKKVGKPSTSPWSMLKNGMQVKKGKNGTGSMQNEQVLEKESLLKKYVTNAIKNMMPKHTTKDSARISVRQRIGTHRGLTTSQEIAWCVEQNSSVTNMSLKERVVRNVTLSLQTTQKVYDIEIEDDHCYFANGFLVSNSDAMRYLCAGYHLVGDGGSVENDFKAMRSYWGDG